VAYPALRDVLGDLTPDHLLAEHQGEPTCIWHNGNTVTVCQQLLPTVTVVRSDMQRPAMHNACCVPRTTVECKYLLRRCDLALQHCRSAKKLAATCSRAVSYIADEGKRDTLNDVQRHSQLCTLQL
jgi:hypothetical protein